MKQPDHRPWKVLNSEYLAHEPWFTVRREAVELPGGARIPSYYVLEYPDWVNVIARTDDGRFLLIDQYRHGLGRTSYEIVAGVRDPQDATPLDAAPLTWQSTVNFAHNRNRVIKLHDELREYVYGPSSFSSSYAMKLVEGGSIGDIYGRAFERDAMAPQ